MRGGEWIKSGGGPLVHVAEGDLPHWAGTDLVGDDPVSDYDRACAVAGAIKPLKVRGIEIVVLGNEPDSSLVLPIEGVTHLLRWRWAPDEETMWGALSHADLSGLEWETEGGLDAQVGGYRLFDSAYPCAEIEESRTIAFEPG